MRGISKKVRSFGSLTLFPLPALWKVVACLGMTLKHHAFVFSSFSSSSSPSNAHERKKEERGRRASKENGFEGRKREGQKILLTSCGSLLLSVAC